MTATIYPLRLEAELDRDLSRWLWLVKWFLAIPHFFVLAFLWIGYVVTTSIAFFAIAFTGRYPPALFEFNVGVLRWTWRVMFYSFGANGTDRYPPFALSEDPSYPTHLEVTYPDRLSKGLVWIKWWLLAIPHYLIVGVFIGGGSWVAWNVGRMDWAVYGNLLGVLVLIAAVILAVRGAYPTGLFDLIMGINRWVLRVAAYAGLMTDEYPPFRLDVGGPEPGETLTIPRPPSPPPAPEQGSRGGWTGGRVTALVLGSLLGMTSIGLLGGGGFLLWMDGTQRDPDGFLTSPTQRFTTETYALVTDGEGIRGEVRPSPGPVDPVWVWWWADTLRLRATGVGQRPIFLGVGPAVNVERYLAAVERAELIHPVPPRYAIAQGDRVPGVPEEQDFWIARSRGVGQREVTWRPSLEEMSVVVMSADGSPGVDVRVDAAIRARYLGAVAWSLLGSGAVLAALAIALVVGAIRRASRGGSVRPVFTEPERSTKQEVER